MQKAPDDPTPLQIADACPAVTDLSSFLHRWQGPSYRPSSNRKPAAWWGPSFHPTSRLSRMPSGGLVLALAAAREPEAGRQHQAESNGLRLHRVLLFNSAAGER